MNDYIPETHRAPFAAAAVALSALTLATFVILPAAFDSQADQVLVLAAAHRAMTEPIEVAIEPSRIDVVAAREPNVAWALGDSGKPNCKPEV